MTPKYNKLAGKHVLVIGGLSGIGLGVAEASLASGANVTISSSSIAKLTATVTYLQNTIPSSSQQKIQSFAADLSGPDAEVNIEAVFTQAGATDHVVFTAANTPPVGLEVQFDLAAAQELPINYIVDYRNLPNL